MQAGVLHNELARLCRLNETYGNGDIRTVERWRGFSAIGVCLRTKKAGKLAGRFAADNEAALGSTRVQQAGSHAAAA